MVIASVFTFSLLGNTSGINGQTSLRNPIPNSNKEPQAGIDAVLEELKDSTKFKAQLSALKQRPVEVEQSGENRAGNAGNTPILPNNTAPVLAAFKNYGPRSASNTKNTKP